ncbi:hypothetical protein FRB91_011026 [Serendipita sp. 411]|nr:hypothetical protein FRB91_011026 [Serendipita sp. 411]
MNSDSSDNTIRSTLQPPKNWIDTPYQAESLCVGRSGRRSRFGDRIPFKEDEGVGGERVIGGYRDVVVITQWVDPKRSKEYEDT